MRFGILAVGLLVWFVAMIQIMLVSGFSDAANDTDTQNAAGAGIIGLFIWLFGLLIVIPWPRLAMIFFALAAGLMFLGSPDFPDLAVWGSVALVFAVLSYVGSRQKRGKDRKDAERDQMFEKMLHAQNTMAGVMTAPLVSSQPTQAVQPSSDTPVRICSSCGSAVQAGQRFCPDCGMSQSQ